jgi:hypothetical protein
MEGYKELTADISNRGWVSTSFNHSIIQWQSDIVGTKLLTLKYNIWSRILSEIKLKRGTKSKKRCKDKKWHDTDLKSLRRKLINYGKVYSKFPHDPLVRGIFFVFEFVNNIPIQFWVIVMKRLKLINHRVLVLPVFELPQSGILLVKFEIMPSY